MPSGYYIINPFKLHDNETWIALIAKACSMFVFTQQRANRNTTRLSASTISK